MNAPASKDLVPKTSKVKTSKSKCLKVHGKVEEISEAYLVSH